jgi:hypothetical protein
MAYTDIDDPSVHFQTALYTGNATQRDITNDGNSDLQPDWVWIKCRSAAEANMLYDSTRGVTKDLRSDGTNAENTNAQGLQAFNSDGFQLGTLQNTNFNTKTMVAWQWKANGGTTTTNDASATGIGTIDSVYQANTTAGFSIVTYTGTTSAGSIAHGLGAVPKMIIVKNIQDGAENWAVQSPTASDPWTDYMWLDLPNALDDNAGLWNDTAPTSTVFTIGTSGVVSQAENHVAYCFAEKQGYSKFGSYVGNSNANGTFVYTGFKPAWIMIKHTGSFGADQQYATWGIWDNKRATSNVVTQATMLTANNQYQEGNRGNNSSSTLVALDMLSNGFKIRNTSYEVNQPGTYIYMAFAENPFVSSTGTPTTAR